MRQIREKRRKKRPGLVTRLALRLSTSRRVDRLWVGTFEPEPEPLLRRVEEALCLIKAYDRLRYERLIRDLDRVWVQVLPGALGRFDESVNACLLDPRFVLAETSLPEMIASTIIHEATHARLRRRGIGNPEELRARVEAVCGRRELAFAAKLPHGEQVRERAERYLEFCTSAGHEYWTDRAFDERRLEGGVEAFRFLGSPNWLARTLVALVAAHRSVRRLIPGRGTVLRLLDDWLWPLIAFIIAVIVIKAVP